MGNNSLLKSMEEEIKETLDYRALTEAAEELVFSGNMLIAAAGEVPVQLIRFDNGRVYKLSVVCKIQEGS